MLISSLPGQSVALTKAYSIRNFHCTVFRVRPAAAVAAAAADARLPASHRFGDFHARTTLRIDRRGARHGHLLFLYLVIGVAGGCLPCLSVWKTDDPVC